MPSKPAYRALGLAQSGFELGDPQVGGGELARAVEQVLLQHPQAVRGIALTADLFAQSWISLAQRVLVGFLAVLGEAGAFERGRELGLQFGDVIAHRSQVAGDGAVGGEAGDAEGVGWRGGAGGRCG